MVHRRPEQINFYIVICLFQIFISITSCEVTDTATQKRILDSAKLKDEIIIIEVDKDRKEFKDNGFLFRMKLLTLLRQLSLSKPSAIYLSFTWSRNMKGESKFAEELKKFEVISSVSLNEGVNSTTLDPQAIQLLGNKIKGKYSKNIYRYFEFSSIETPSVELMKAHRALCVNRHYSNQTGIDIIYPYHYFNYFLFEDCSITITNEILSRNSLNLQIESSDDGEKFYLHDTAGGNYKRIKELKYVETPGGFIYTPINFKPISVFNDGQILNKKNWNFESSIIIICDKAFEASYKFDYKYTSSEILANKISTLLRLISDNP